MKMTQVVILTVLTLVAALAIYPAYAADKGGVYVSAKGGYEYKGRHSTLSDANQNNATFNSAQNSGYAVGGAIGYNFVGMGLPVRAETEYLYHSQFKPNLANATSGGATGSFSSKIDIHTVFANVYYDIKTGTAFTPYVGAGLGVAWINQKVASTFTGWNPATDDGNYNTAHLAWNVGAGVGYALTYDHGIVLDLGLRYTSFGDAKKVSNAANSITFQAKDLKALEALLGLRYQF